MVNSEGIPHKRRRLSMAKKSKYIIPEFNLERFIAKVDEVVRQAPFGIVKFVIDLFCGAGGTSEGFEKAMYKDAKVAMIIAGINHDLKAIFSQYMNHPDAYYSTEDIRIANLDMIRKIVAICRERWPQCPIFIWASLECTNHSNAKGGMSRDADSRTLAWHLDRYVEQIRPDGIWIENVKEFAEWGPLMEKSVLERRVLNKKRKYVRKRITINEIIDPAKEEQFYRKAIKEGWVASSPLTKIKEDKKVIGVKKTEIPIKSLKGTLYRAWKEKMETFGFYSEQRLLNCAEYGCPTNRKRLFIIFIKEGWPIRWCRPTHAKDTVKYPGLAPLVPVKTCLDFSVQGESIFTPGKITSRKTFRRILAGLLKYVAGGEDAYIAQRNGGDSRTISVDGPARTVTTTGGNMELVKAYFLARHNTEPQGSSPDAGTSVEDSCPTITTKSTIRLVEADFLIKYYGTMQRAIGMDDSADTLTTKDRMAYLSPSFLLNYQGKSFATSLDDTSPAILTRDKLALISGIKYFIYRQFSDGRTQDINSPAGALTTFPKMNLIEIAPWVMTTSFDNVGYSINETADAILASRKHHYLMNPQYADDQGCSIENPCFTLIARMDKAAPYLISTDRGHVLIPVFKKDCEEIVKIKEFMAVYGIVDIKMRMLLIPELLQIQSFPPDYYLSGSQTDKKKYIGNAVPPLMARRLAEGLYEGLFEFLTLRLAA